MWQCLILGLSLVLAIGAVRPPAVHAVGKLLYLDQSESFESRCEIQGISGKFSPPDSAYSASGRCVVYRLRGGAIQDIANTIKWEATGKYNQATKASEENVHLLRLVRPDQPNYASIGRISAKMQCGQDPWLNPDRYGCSDMFYGRSESLSQLELGDLYASNRNVPRTSLLSSVQRAALNKQYQVFLAVYQATHQPLKPGAAKMATKKPAVDKPYTPLSTAIGSRQCNQGFVWRMAGPNDSVCVPPESRQRALQENATAASRRNPKGPYGPNTCLTGFVWREAFSGDVVCVTPEVRQLVRQENELNSSRSTGAGQIMRR